MLICILFLGKFPMRTLRRVGRVGNAPPLMASRSTSHISASTIAAAANTVANADESSTGRSVGQSTLTHSGKRNSSALPSHYRRQSSDTRGGETGRSISHSSRAPGLQTEGILREGLFRVWNKGFLLEQFAVMCLSLPAV